MKTETASDALCVETFGVASVLQGVEVGRRKRLCDFFSNQPKSSGITPGTELGFFRQFSVVAEDDEADGLFVKNGFLWLDGRDFFVEV